MAELRADADLRRLIVFLGGAREDGEFVPYGTAFLIAVAFGKGIGASYLVTAGHVLDDIAASNLRPVARQNTKNGSFTLANIPPPEKWYRHPTIEGLDLAVIPTRVSNDMFDVTHCETRFFLTDKYIADNEVGPNDEVFVVGLLTRHFGRTRNVPIVRTGNIAAMPGEPLDLGDFGQHPAYLIESRSIGGLSGSPVFLATPYARVIGNLWRKNPRTEGHERYYLLGVNIGLFETMAHADRVLGEPLSQRQAFLETMNAGIAVVLPIQRVAEILQHPKLVEMREIMLKNCELLDSC